MAKFRLVLLLLLAVLLTGCNMSTVEELYCLPRRSDAYNNLQSLIDQIMVGREYCAPISGEHQQTVQIADLDGDGEEEYLLFTKSNSEDPLQITIFTAKNDGFAILDTIESAGASFQQVEYVDLDGDKGVEIVVGRQLSDQVVRSISVYRLIDGKAEEILKTTYSKFVCADMDQDGTQELVLLRPGAKDSDKGVAELYSMNGNDFERQSVVNMSEPADRIKRIMVSILEDGYPAVYVASDAGNSSIITDVYAVVDGDFTNVTFSNESGTSVQTLRSYYVYANDIDSDGVLELPDLINMKPPATEFAQQDHHLIRWYSMTSDGGEIEKIYTYHNFAGGWYLRLSSDRASRIAVIQRGSSYEFYIWNQPFTETEKLLTIHVLTGQKREEQAVIQNRFVLHRTASVIYAAELEVASGAYGMSRDGLVNDFRLIISQWNTGET